MRKIVWWIPALLWAAVLFMFSGQSGEASGSLSLEVTKILLRIFRFLPWSVEELHPVIRKLAHFSFFAIEGGLVSLACFRTFAKKAAIVAAVVICAALSALNEYSQVFAVGRSCEVRDMVIDFCGALLGIAVALLILRLCTHRNPNGAKN